MITHLEPDIMECEVNWTLGSITKNKAGGDDGIPVVLFQILKDDAVKVLHSICQQIWKTQQWPQDWKRIVFISIPIPKEMGIPDHLTCLLRNLYAGQEGTVRTGHGSNRLVPNRKRSTSRLYTVTLLIELLCRVHLVKCWAG